jgi:hypothetical protein
MRHILNKIYLLVLLTGLISISINAQQRILIHSHNDYEQRVPFYQAYAQQVASIEADIYTTAKAND